MIDRIIELSVRHRIVVLVLAGALAVGGLYALAHPEETLTKVEALKRKVKSSLHRHTNP